MRVRFSLLFAALLAACATAPRHITEVSLERGCFGCPASTKLVLRADGTATFTVTGNEPHGTLTIVSKGTVPARDFDGLAKLMTGKGFFSMPDDQSDPQARDGKWTLIAAVRDGVEKKVWNKNDMEPPAFVDVESAIDEVRRSIRFTRQ